MPFCAEIKCCFSLPTVYWQLFHNPLRFPATNPPECGGCEQIVNKAFLEACTVNGKFEKSVFKKYVTLATRTVPVAMNRICFGRERVRCRDVTAPTRRRSRKHHRLQIRVPPKTVEGHRSPKRWRVAQRPSIGAKRPDNVAQVSRLPPDELGGGAGETPALLRGEDIIVVTTAMRALTGTRFRAMLQPTHPARRAVCESGFRLLMAEGEDTRLHPP